MLYTYEYNVFGTGETGTVLVGAFAEKAAKSCANRICNKQFGSGDSFELKLISTDYSVGVAVESDYGVDGSKKYIPSDYVIG